jgi:DNA-binding response OmpR family regulator
MKLVVRIPLLIGAIDYIQKPMKKSELLERIALLT